MFIKTTDSNEVKENHLRADRVSALTVHPETKEYPERTEVVLSGYAETMMVSDSVADLKRKIARALKAEAG